MLSTRVTLALLVACFLVSVTGFDAGRTRYIDHYNEGGVNNFLFRGAEPLTDGAFAWSELDASLRSEAKASGVELPATYYLVDINLLSIHLDFIDIEKDFFRNNPNQGTFVHWPIIGSLYKPSAFPEDMRKAMAEDLDDWTWDKLPRKMTLLREMMQKQYPAPAVLFIHCNAGEDRTGELSGSYYVKWLGWSFEKALEYDNHVEDRDIRCMSQNAFQWYCYYTVYKLGRPMDCSIPGNDTCTF